MTDTEQLVQDTIKLAEAVRNQSERILGAEQENRAFQDALAAAVTPFEGESLDDWVDRALNKDALKTEIEFLARENRLLKWQLRTRR